MIHQSQLLNNDDCWGSSNKRYQKSIRIFPFFSFFTISISFACRDTTWHENCCKNNNNSTDDDGGGRSARLRADNNFSLYGSHLLTLRTQSVYHFLYFTALACWELFPQIPLGINLSLAPLYYDLLMLIWARAYIHSIMNELATQYC